MTLEEAAKVCREKRAAWMAKKEAETMARAALITLIDEVSEAYRQLQSARGRLEANAEGTEAWDDQAPLVQEARRVALEANAEALKKLTDELHAAKPLLPGSFVSHLAKPYPNESPEAFEERVARKKGGK